MIKQFATTKLPVDVSNDSMSDESIVGFVKSTHESWRMARQEVERVWVEAWAIYLGTPDAMEELRNQSLTTVGDVNNDWRHKINVGKAFESVETIHSYLMQATFPNKNWFSAEPTRPGYQEYAKVVENYTLNKLEAANFQSHYENFLRQLCIVGTSVLALPWRYETMKIKKRIKISEPNVERWTLVDSVMSFKEVEEERVISNEPDFSVLDMFDVYLDPNATNPNDSGLIRRITKRRADILELVRKGIYSISELDVMNLKAARSHEDWQSDKVTSFMGVDLNNGVSYDDEIELWEYWGDYFTDSEVYRDVVILISGSSVLRFETNPYWSGKPFVIGTYIPTVNSPYAIGAIQPSLGLLHELNIITNQRLDNLELAVDEMWLMVDDGILNPEDVYTAPGRVITVADMNNLQPVQRSQAFVVTYQESQFLENKINANFGTPPLISNGQVRAGERVTAEEILAIKEAGGNRLSGVHKHIETTTLKVLLSKLYRLMQQFVNESEVIRVTGREAGSFNYYQVDPDTFLYDFLLKPLGADFVIGKQKFVQDRVQLLQITAQFPEMSQLINYEQVLRDILQQMGFDDPDKYLKEAPEAQTPEGAPIDPNASNKQELQQMGGDHLLTAAQASEQATGSPEQFLQSMMGEEQSATIPSVEDSMDDPLLN